MENDFFKMNLIKKLIKCQFTLIVKSTVKESKEICCFGR